MYIELPEVNSTINAGWGVCGCLRVSDSFSSVESVKAAADAFCPASGKVLEVNTVRVECCYER